MNIVTNSAKAFLIFGLIVSSKVQADEEYQARFDIVGKEEKIKLEPGSCSGGEIGPSQYYVKQDLGDFVLMTRLPVVKKKWREKKCTFTAMDDGRVSIHFISQWVKGDDEKPKNIVIEYVDLKIDGAYLENANFSETDDEGKLPYGWWGKGRVIEGKGPGGKNILRAGQRMRTGQNFDVSKGKKITISFKARLHSVD